MNNDFFYLFNFDNKIDKFCSKFWWQPDLLENISWPTSKTNWEKMQFICQINLQNIWFTDDFKMLYLFIWDDETDNFEPDLWDNLVLIQKNNDKKINIDISWPTIEENFEKSITLKKVEKSSDWFYEDFEVQWITNKILGTPEFIQDEEYPKWWKKEWNFFMQIDSQSLPFHINFWDAWVWYIFLDKDFQNWRFLFQSL